MHNRTRAKRVRLIQSNTDNGTLWQNWVMAKAPPTITEYIAVRPEPVRELLEALQSLLEDTLPEAASGMKWGAPVWFNAEGEPVIYLYGGKAHAHLGFVHGAALADPDELLKGASKTGRHVKLLPGQPLPTPALVALIRQAAS